MSLENGRVVLGREPGGEGLQGGDGVGQEIGADDLQDSAERSGQGLQVW